MKYDVVRVTKLRPAERILLRWLTPAERAAILLEAARKKAEKAETGQIDSQIDSQREEGAAE